MFLCNILSKLYMKNVMYQKLFNKLHITCTILPQILIQQTSQLRGKTSLQRSHVHLGNDLASQASEICPLCF